MNKKNQINITLLKVLNQKYHQIFLYKAFIIHPKNRRKITCQISMFPVAISQNKLERKGTKFLHF